MGTHQARCRLKHPPHWPSSGAQHLNGAPQCTNSSTTCPIHHSILQLRVTGYATLNLFRCLPHAHLTRSQHERHFSAQLGGRWTWISERTGQCFMLSAWHYEMEDAILLDAFQSTYWSCDSWIQLSSYSSASCILEVYACSLLICGLIKSSWHWFYSRKAMDGQDKFWGALCN